jgi:hypothetical protein
MTPQERKTYYSEFLVEGLLRGDITVRYQAYAVGRQWGWLSADDVRRLENMDTLPEGQGEKYLLPLNMIDASKLDEYLLTQQEKSEPTIADDDQTEDSVDVEESRTAFEDAIDRHVERSDGGFIGEGPFRPVFRSTFERFIERLAKSGKPFAHHRNVIKQGVDPIVAGLLLLNERQDADAIAVTVVDSLLDRWSGDSRTADELSDLIIELTKDAVRLN